MTFKLIVFFLKSFLSVFDSRWNHRWVLVMSITQAIHIFSNVWRNEWTTTLQQNNWKCLRIFVMREIWPCEGIQEATIFRLIANTGDYIYDVSIINEKHNRSKNNSCSCLQQCFKVSSIQSIILPSSSFYNF